MKLNRLTLIALAIGLTFSSCSNDDNNDIPIILPVGENDLGPYQGGILISEEGNFSNGTGAITFVSSDLETVQNNAFQSVNETLLGNLVQSIAFNDDHAYIIENGSNAIKVVNRYTLELIASISDPVMVSPRYMAISNGKGYVTNWGDFMDASDDKVVVIDLSTNTIVDTIATAYLPEEIIASDDSVYFITGIYSTGNQVQIIDVTTNEISGNLTVGSSPNSIQFDSEGDIWALSSERLVEISKADNTILKTFNFLPDDTASKLYYSNNSFYYHLAGSIYNIDETASILPSNSLFDFSNLYDFSVKDNQFFGLDHNGFSAEESFLKIVDLSTNTEIKTISLGSFAGEVYFN